MIFLFCAGFLIFFHSNLTAKFAVHVQILENASFLKIDAKDQFLTAEVNTGNQKVFSGQTIVKPAADGILFPQQIFKSPLKISSVKEEDFLILNGRRYRGNFLVKKNGSEKISVINELELEDYLSGILPREVNPNWHLEALKAQAVASRTYALKNLDRHGSEGFDFCNGAHCQVYGGMEAENPQTNLAVDKTELEVVTYDDDLANTVFFSNCGGRTESAHNVWVADFSPPYLKSVRCKNCKNTPQSLWEKNVPEDFIARSLNKNGFEVKAPIRSIRIKSYGKSGRAKYLQVYHSEGSVLIPANKFRLGIGAETIRSTFLTEIKKIGENFRFRGKGWGHGVGMCQVGAKGLAESGKDYKRILRFYFPNTRVERLKELRYNDNNE